MDSMRYDHVMMSDHVAAQAQLVAHMTDLQNQAMGVLNQLAQVWTQHGSNAYQQCHYQVSQAFQSVFDTIQRHGQTVGQSSNNALVTDHGVAAGFLGL
jgi:uncharacterized protein YukE